MLRLWTPDVTHHVVIHQMVSTRVVSWRGHAWQVAKWDTRLLVISLLLWSRRVSFVYSLVHVQGGPTEGGFNKMKYAHQQKYTIVGC